VPTEPQSPIAPEAVQVAAGTEAAETLKSFETSPTTFTAPSAVLVASGGKPS
jgi:hypothetical protein